MGAVAEREVVVIALSNLANEEEERKPELVLVAVAIESVQEPDEELIWSPDEPDEARVRAR
jgi:hypothetical protein